MKARDIMATDIRTVGPDATIDVAIKIMTDRRVTGVPVVDDTGTLVGILTEGDLLRRVETGTGDHLRPLFLDLLLGSGKEAVQYVRTHSRRVRDLMSPHVVTVTEDDSLSEVVRLMERRRNPSPSGGAGWAARRDRQPVRSHHRPRPQARRDSPRTRDGSGDRGAGPCRAP